MFWPYSIDTRLITQHNERSTINAWPYKQCIRKTTEVDAAKILFTKNLLLYLNNVINSLPKYNQPLR